MTAPSKAIAKFLEAEGIGVFGGKDAWAIHTVIIPDGPDYHANIIGVFDTGGGEPDTAELDLTSPTFQVLIRCLKYSDGYARQEAIRDLLIQTAPIVSEGVTFILVRMTSDIIHVGRDDSNRFVLSANYQTVRQL